MVQINIGAGQGITQAIRDKIGAGNIKNSNLETWQKVMTEVNNAQSKEKGIFSAGENNTADVNKLADKSTWSSNFVVDEGSVEIDDGVWNKIKELLTGKAEVSVPAQEAVTQEASVQSEPQNITSHEQAQAPRDNNAEIQNQETVQSPKKYLSTADLEQCKQMLQLNELPEGVSIAKENGQFLFYKDDKQIPLSDVKNSARKTVEQSEPQNATSSEQPQATKVNDSEIQKPHSEKIVETTVQEKSVSNKPVEASEVREPENPTVSQTDYSFLAVKDLSNKGKKVVKDGVTYQYDNEGYISRGYKDGQKIFETSMLGSSVDARFMSKDEILKSGEGQIAVNTYDYSNDKKLMNSEKRLLDGTLLSSSKYDKQGNEIENNKYNNGKIYFTVHQQYDYNGNVTNKVSVEDGKIVFMENSVYNSQNKVTEKYQYINPIKGEPQFVGEEEVQVFEKYRVDRNAPVGSPVAWKAIVNDGGLVLTEQPILYQE